MRLPVAALLLACEAAAFSWTGNFGERIVSGSSAQIDQDADRYGNVNQLHGKHVFSYTQERQAYEATLEKDIQQPPPPPHQPQQPPAQQQQQAATAAVPTEEQTPPEPRSSVATTEQIPTTTASTTGSSTPEETSSVGAPETLPDTRNRQPAIATSVGTAASGAVSPDAIRNRGELHGGYGGYTIGAKTPPDTRDRRPSAGAAASNAVSPDAIRNRGELHGGYGGYSRPLGTFSTVSGSSAQYVDDRYGNINQLHGKHCHDYTMERAEFEAAAIEKEQKAVPPRPNDVVGKDPDVNQEAC